MSFPPLKEETSPSVGVHIQLMVLLLKLGEAYPRVGRSVSAIEHSGGSISIVERDISAIGS